MVIGSSVGKIPKGTGGRTYEGLKIITICKMGLQIPFGFCLKIPRNDNLWRVKDKDRWNNQNPNKVLEIESSRHIMGEAILPRVSPCISTNMRLSQSLVEMENNS